MLVCFGELAGCEFGAASIGQLVVSNRQVCPHVVYTVTCYGAGTCSWYVKFAFNTSVQCQQMTWKFLISLRLVPKVHNMIGMLKHISYALNLYSSKFHVKETVLKWSFGTTSTLRMLLHFVWVCVATYLVHRSSFWWDSTSNVST